MPPAVPCLPKAVFGVPVEHVAGEDDVADEAITRALRPRLLRLVFALPKRSAYVTIHHFGLLGVPPRSLREIAADLGVSVGTVHAAERQALELLREWL